MNNRNEPMLIHEYEIDEETEREIARLRNEAFPDFTTTRSYYKQLPHFRFLLREEGKLAGHVAVDYRVISLDGEPARIMGVVDLCVAKERRGRGMGGALLEAVERLARKTRTDFIILFADEPGIYEAHGFARGENTCTWLKIHEHRTLGIAEDSLADCLFVKPTGDRAWTGGRADLLGYLF